MQINPNILLAAYGIDPAVWTHAAEAALRAQQGQQLEPSAVAAWQRMVEHWDDMPEYSDGAIAAQVDSLLADSEAAAAGAYGAGSKQRAGPRKRRRKKKGAAAATGAAGANLGNESTAEGGEAEGGSDGEEGTVAGGSKTGRSTPKPTPSTAAPAPPMMHGTAPPLPLQALLAARPRKEELRAAGILRGPPSVDPQVAAAAESIRKLLQRDALARNLRNRLSAVDLRQRGILRDPEAGHKADAIEALARALEKRPARTELARFIHLPPIMVWTVLLVPAIVPAGIRNCHAAVLHGRRLYVLGGHSEKEVEHPLSPAVLDASDRGNSGWSRPPTWTAAGFEPVSRYAHSVINYEGVLVLFGGYSATSGWTNDVWLLDVRSGQSRGTAANRRGEGAHGASSGPGTPTPPPSLPSNSRRSAISMPDEFGVPRVEYDDEDGAADAASGIDAGPMSPAAQPVTDVLTWHLPPIAGHPPCPRAAHTATLAGQYMVVFGGNDGSTLYNDTHLLVLGRSASRPRGGGSVPRHVLTWHAVLPAGAPPSPRSGHTAVAHKDLGIVVFGGGEGWGANCFNDLFVLHVDEPSLPSNSEHSCVWMRPSWQGTAPGPRTGHSACVIGDTMMVFGGFDGKRALNDLHILDLRNMTWSRPADTGAVPPPRAGHTATAIGAYCLIFGGSKADGELFGDVHVLDTQFTTPLDALPPSRMPSSSSSSATAGAGGDQPGSGSRARKGHRHGHEESSEGEETGSAEDDEEDDSEGESRDGIATTGSGAVQLHATPAVMVTGGSSPSAGGVPGIAALTSVLKDRAHHASAARARTSNADGNQGRTTAKDAATAILTAAQDQQQQQQQMQSATLSSPSRPSQAHHTSAPPHTQAPVDVSRTLPTPIPVPPPARVTISSWPKATSSNSLKPGGVPWGTIPLGPAEDLGGLEGSQAYGQAGRSSSMSGGKAAHASSAHSTAAPSLPPDFLAAVQAIGQGKGGRGEGSGATAAQATAAAAALTTVLQVLRSDILKSASRDEARYESLAWEIQAWRAQRRQEHRACINAIDALRVAITGGGQGSAGPTGSTSSTTSAAFAPVHSPDRSPRPALGKEGLGR